MKFGQNDSNTSSYHPQEQLYQYRCASCGTLLKETETPIDNSVFHFLNERCTVCDSILQQQTVIIKERNTRPPPPIYQRQKEEDQLLLPPAAASLLPRFERASDAQRHSMLTFDIPQIDSSLDPVDNGALWIMGKGRVGDYYANILITRLCVRAFLSKKKRYNGLDSSAVIFIDAGNCSDIYQACNFARQYGLDSKSILDRVIVSRPFTIHQLAGLIVHDLDELLQRTRTKLVVITDILRMFLEDPQQQIDSRDEARWLIKEMARELRKVSKMAFLAVSLREDVSEYQNIMMASIFDARIISIGPEPKSSNNLLQIDVHNQRRHHNHLDQTNRKFTIAEKDLLVIPPPR